MAKKEELANRRDAPCSFCVSLLAWKLVFPQVDSLIHFGEGQFSARGCCVRSTYLGPIYFSSVFYSQSFYEGCILTRDLSIKLSHAEGEFGSTEQVFCVVFGNTGSFDIHRRSPVMFFVSFSRPKQDWVRRVFFTHAGLRMLVSFRILPE